MNQINLPNLLPIYLFPPTAVALKQLYSLNQLREKAKGVTVYIPSHLNPHKDLIYKTRVQMPDGQGWFFDTGGSEWVSRAYFNSNAFIKWDKQIISVEMLFANWLFFEPGLFDYRWAERYVCGATDTIPFPLKRTYKIA